MGLKCETCAGDIPLLESPRTVTEGWRVIYFCSEDCRTAREVRLALEVHFADPEPDSDGE